MMTLFVVKISNFNKLNTATSQEIIENTVDKLWLQGVKVVLSSGYIKCQRNMYICV